MTDIRVAAEQARVALQLAREYVHAAGYRKDSINFVRIEATRRVGIVDAALASLEAALAALPGDKGQGRPGSYVNAANISASDMPHEVVRKLDEAFDAFHSAATPAVEVPPIAGRDGASAAPILTDAQITKIIEHADGSEFSDYEFARAIEAALLAHLALTSPGLPSASPLPSLSRTDDSALPQGEVGGPTYYVRHPDDSYTVADPQPVASPAAAGVPTGYEWSKDAKAFVRHNANGTDTVLSPLVSIAAELRVMLASAIEHSDGEWITGYTIKTGALHRILGLMAAAGYTVSIPTGSRAASPVALPRVTEFNVGRWCLSEDDCIAGGIDFAAYERGVADAARAFGQSPRQVAHSSQAQGELSAGPVVTNNGRMNEENQNG